jgi:hypothetical protein
MSVERSVLISICRLISGATVNSPDAVGNSNINVEQLLKCCQYHQIVPLVYYYRKELLNRFSMFNSAFNEKIKTQALFNITRVMIYEHYLKILNDKFKEKGIEFRTFKGLITAHTLYSESYLRSFGDLDILIKSKSLSAVHELLSNQEFEIARDLYHSFPDAIIRKYSFARHYIRCKPNPIAIDVHLNLSGKLHPFQFDYLDFWSNSESVRIGDSDVATFDREHQAIYALYHAFKHYYFKIIWFIDLFLYVDQETLNAEYFIKLLKRYKLLRIWRLFLPVAVALFGRLPRVAQEIDFKISKPHPVINGDAVLKGSLPYTESRGRLILPLFYISGVGDKLKFIWRQLLPPREAVKDFYGENPLPDNWRNYLKLRRQALIGLYKSK